LIRQDSPGPCKMHNKGCVQVLIRPRGDSGDGKHHDHDHRSPPARSSTFSMTPACAASLSFPKSIPAPHTPACSVPMGGATLRWGYASNPQWRGLPRRARARPGTRWVPNVTPGNFKSGTNTEGDRSFYPLFHLVSLSDEATSTGIHHT
jgi:hypothetical protein